MSHLSYNSVAAKAKVFNFNIYSPKLTAHACPPGLHVPNMFFSRALKHPYFVQTLT